MTLWDRPYYLQLTDEEMEAKRNEVTHPRSHGQAMAVPDRGHLTSYVPESRLLNQLMKWIPTQEPSAV